MSPSPRIYQPIELSPDTLVTLDKKASHHVAQVLRAKIGESIILFNGKGGEYQGKIVSIKKNGVEIALTHFSSPPVESPIDIYLAQGIARGKKMDIIIQKAVELGIKKIFPLVTERCNVKLDQSGLDKRLQHWQSIAVSACEQSGRISIPEVHPIEALHVWLKTLPSDANYFVLTPHLKTNDSPHQLNKNQPIILLIGPEGGLTDNEIQCAFTKGMHPLRLGPRIMRTETAAIAAISIFQSRYGDMSNTS